MPAMAIAGIEGFGVGLILPLLVPITRGIGAGPRESGALRSIYGLVQLFTAPYAGVAADGWNKKAVLIYSFFIVGFSYVLLALSSLSTSLPLFIASRIMTGIFKHTSMLTTAMVADMDVEQTEAFGRIRFASILGFAGAPPVGGFLADKVGPSFVTFLGASTFFLSGIVAQVLVPKSKKDLKSKVKNGDAKKAGGFLAVWKNFSKIPQATRHVLSVRLAIGIALGLFWEAQGWILDENTEATGAEIGMIDTLTSITAALTGALLLKPIKYAFGANANVALLGLLCDTLSMALFVTSPALRITTVASIAVAFSSMIMTAGMNALLNETVSEDSKGLILGLTESILAAISAITPGLSGILLNLMGARASVTVSVALAVYAIVSLQSLHSTIGDVSYRKRASYAFGSLSEEKPKAEQDLKRHSLPHQVSGRADSSRIKPVVGHKKRRRSSRRRKGRGSTHQDSFVDHSSEGDKYSLKESIVTAKGQRNSEKLGRKHSRRSQKKLRSEGKRHANDKKRHSRLANIEQLEDEMRWLEDERSMRHALKQNMRLLPSRGQRHKVGRKPIKYGKRSDVAGLLDYRYSSPGWDQGVFARLREDIKIFYSKPYFLTEWLGLIAVAALIGFRPKYQEVANEPKYTVQALYFLTEGALHLLSDEEPATLYGVVLMAGSAGLALAWRVPESPTADPGGIFERGVEGATCGLFGYLVMRGLRDARPLNHIVAFLVICLCIVTAELDTSLIEPTSSSVVGIACGILFMLLASPGKYSGSDYYSSLALME